MKQEQTTALSDEQLQQAIKIKEAELKILLDEAEKETAKESDLVLGEGEETGSMEYEFTPLETYVACACAAIDTMESFNAFTKEDTKLKERIMKKSMALLDYAINELHKEIEE